MYTLPDPNYFISQPFFFISLSLSLSLSLNPCANASIFASSMDNMVNKAFLWK